MSYTPKVNDYVTWTKGVEGWVYFKCKDYITIEDSTTPKDPENLADCPIHKKTRVLVLCFHEQWKELIYVKTRASKYEE
jgi:hypothetical protein